MVNNTAQLIEYKKGINYFGISEILFTKKNNIATMPDIISIQQIGTNLSPHFLHTISLSEIVLKTGDWQKILPSFNINSQLEIQSAIDEQGTVWNYDLKVPFHNIDELVRFNFHRCEYVFIIKLCSGICYLMGNIDRGADITIIEDSGKFISSNKSILNISYTNGGEHLPFIKV